MNTVGFPNLKIEFHPDRFINVFGLDIAWYAIIIAAGFVLACIYVLSRMKKFGLDADRAIEAILAGMVGAIIGARLYFVAFQWDDYKDNLMDIFQTRKGGLAIYGAIIGGILFGLIVCRIRKIKMLPMLDLVALGFLLGQGIGRWGNFINQEAYGAVVSDNYILGMTGDLIYEGMVHPCFLYESIWCLLGFILLHFYSKHRKFDGEIGLMYLVWYGAERMIVEGLRTDSLMWGNFRVSQILSAALLLVGLIMILVIRSKIRRNNDPEYLKLYVHTEESKKMLEEAAERYSKSKDRTEKHTGSEPDSIAAEEEETDDSNADSDEESDGEETDADAEVQDLKEDTQKKSQDGNSKQNNSEQKDSGQNKTEGDQ